MKLLFAEDDADLNRAVKTLLERSGYTVESTDNGEDAVDLAEEGDFDGMILDWMMPRMDGVEALRTMRARGVSIPCLMLTARDAVEDRVTGLDAGADDYLPKPFSTAELQARVRAMLRRKETYVPDLMSFEDLVLDKSSREIRCGDKSARLNNKAFQCLEMLMEHPHQVLSIEQMMDHVWGWDSEAEINVVWVNISQLRKKLGELGSAVDIRVARGVGYSLEKRAE
mgnify:CR=1 FL=1